MFIISGVATDNRAVSISKSSYTAWKVYSISTKLYIVKWFKFDGCLLGILAIFSMFVLTLANVIAFQFSYKDQVYVKL